MEIPATSQDDVLALPARARLFGALRDLRRPATTHELAECVGRHPNTVRLQLLRLEEAGLVERRRAPQRRGRPRDDWAIAGDAMPAGQPPQAHAQLGQWLARVVSAGANLQGVEQVGRDIGRELAPEAKDRPLEASMHDVLSSLGFAPRRDPEAADRMRFVLGNCPYREAVRQSQPAVCTLHRGITKGLLDELDPGAELVDFVPKEPYQAGCIIELQRPPS